MLDFSKLELRRIACQKEAMLNKMLCDDVYKGVVKIVQSDNNSYRKNNKDIKLQIVDLSQREGNRICCKNEGDSTKISYG